MKNDFPLSVMIRAPVKPASPPSHYVLVFYCLHPPEALSNLALSITPKNV
jgi:hypothetical protein